MNCNHLKIPLFLAFLATSIGVMATVDAADTGACTADKEADQTACFESCNRFEADEEKAECKKSCEADVKPCDETARSSEAAETNKVSEPATPVLNPPATESPASPPPSDRGVSSEPVSTETPPPALQVETKAKGAVDTKSDAALSEQGMKRALKRNEEMLDAIRGGDLKTIRRLVTVNELSPTYVHAYERVAQTGMYKPVVARLRLGDVFNDTNTSHSDAAGLDHVLALFMELGMDVKATIPVAVTTPTGKIETVSRTAWGPNLRLMEGAKDRASRLRSLEMALQAGLAPNDDIGALLFEELPQICGRDKSQFSIQVVDVLIKYLNPALKDYFRRPGERGMETLSDVLDRSYSQRQPKNALEKELFAKQDAQWENCAPLSRRINKYMTQGK